jgi:hypothetical protein
VEGDLAAAVDVDDVGAAGIERTFVGLRALAAGEHRRVLEQQHRLRPAAGHLGVHLSLEVPRSAVVDQAQPAVFERPHPIEGSTPVDDVGADGPDCGTLERCRSVSAPPCWSWRSA